MEPLIQRRILSDRELHITGASDLASRARVLLRQQKETWPLLRTGYAGLADVRTRTIDMDAFTLRVQWNPGRIVSSSANVDPEAIRRRKCFLCSANLPEEQRGVLFASNFLLLCNPFPIFNEHFTIPHTTHSPQRIDSSFGTMLDLARAMAKGYLLTYNGPKSGASAPDHLHFQAGEKGFLPLEKELGGLLAKGEVLADAKTLQVIASDDGLRRFFALRSTEKEPLIGALGDLESALAAATGQEVEPMMNVLASFDGGGWTVLVFPRARHRPSMYFAEGEERLLISPAAVDCGGVLTLPREQDFQRITADHIREIFGEVFLPAGTFQKACATLAGSLTPR
jgi:hypothetical protein